MRRHDKGGISRHLSYANVVATLALFLVIGGGAAVAASLKKNSVKSKQIASNAVKTAELNDAAVTSAEVAGAAVTTPKLADASVTTSKLADGAVTAPKIGKNAVTGAEVDEATLEKVPAAAAADTVGGATADDLRSASAFGSSAGGGGFGTSFGTVASAIITTRSSGRILASGSAELAGQAGGETGECKLDIDGDDSASYRDQVPTGGAVPNEIVIAVNHAIIRPPGTYSVALLCRATGAFDAINKGPAAVVAYGLGT